MSCGASLPGGSTWDLTGDLDNRVREHNARESKSTRSGVPWTLVHFETFDTRSEAVRRERYFKTGKGRLEFKRLLG